MSHFVTINDIASLLNCSTKTVRRKVEKGIIPAIQPDGPGTLLRFEVAEVVRAVKSPSNELLKTDSLTTSDKRKQGPSPSSDPHKLSGPIPKWKRKLHPSHKET